MTDPRPLASVSLDVDDLWSYMKTHGDPGWEARPSYYDTFFPIALDALGALDLRLTFFLVGIDAERDEHHAILQAAAARGHEFGNHSYEHEPWLHLYERQRLVDDIVRAESAIVQATGYRPIGFRGPGYSWSPTLFEILADRGYLFDASTLPTYLGPLARAYYFWTAKLSPAEREQRRALFGSARDGLRSIKPYYWELDGGRRLLEIPVTTTPVIKTPFHLSYLLYLSRYSDALMIAYLRTALAACRATGVEPSFLLHPLDLLGGDQVPALKFFPGMDISGRRKVEIFMRALRVLGEHFRLVTMGAHARAILARPAVAVRSPVATAAAAG